MGWTNPATDWDVYVYDETGAQVASAATGGTNSERATMLLPDPGTYTVRFVNYDQVDGAPGRRLDRQRDVRGADAGGRRGRRRPGP